MTAAAASSIERTLFDLASARSQPLRLLVVVIVVCGPLYGAFMGSYALESPARLLMVAYAALKAPILIFATTAICLPGYFVLNTIAGLRRDFGRAFGAILAGQAGLTVVLASLAPYVSLAYLSGIAYRDALLLNAGMFTIATAASHVILLRNYGQLIARNRRHRPLLWFWVVMYAIVGMQMGWLLRPFVGSPELPVTFFRDEPFSNAYVFIARLIFR